MATTVCESCKPSFCWLSVDQKKASCQLSSFLEKYNDWEGGCILWMFWIYTKWQYRDYQIVAPLLVLPILPSYCIRGLPLLAKANNGGDLGTPYSNFVVCCFLCYSWTLVLWPQMSFDYKRQNFNDLWPTEKHTGLEVAVYWNVSYSEQSQSDSKVEVVENSFCS